MVNSARAVFGGSAMPGCRHCGGLGFCQVYDGRVRRVFCDCEWGDARIAEERKALADAGIPPSTNRYEWMRRSDYF